MKNQIFDQEMKNDLIAAYNEAKIAHDEAINDNSLECIARIANVLHWLGKYVNDTDEIQMIIYTTPPAFLNTDLQRDIEKILSYDNVKLENDEMESDGENIYTIEVNDNTYFYTTFDDREKDLMQLIEICQAHNSIAA